MFIPTSAGNDVSVELSHTLRTLPGLIDVYLLLVDQVMRKHGFDDETGEFLMDRPSPWMSRSEGKSVHISNDIWLELSRLDFLSSNSDRGWTSEAQTTTAGYEKEDLLVVAS